MVRDVFIQTGKGINAGAPSLLHLLPQSVAEKLPHLTRNIWTRETDWGTPSRRGRKVLPRTILLPWSPNTVPESVSALLVVPVL